MTSVVRAATALLAVGALAFFPGHAYAEDFADLGCTIKFSLSTWSALDKHSEGSGIVTCENGKSLRVRIVAIGAGLAVGKSHIDGGYGKFSDVRSMDEILGSYAQMQGHTEVAKAAPAQVLSKGRVLLAISGIGKGVDLGAGVAEFTLTRGGK